MPTLSKSKLLSFKQCPKRLWLELNKPELRCDSEATRQQFDTGNAVGELARRLYDPAGTGVLLEPFASGFAAAFEQTSALLDRAQPIFEGSFTANGALALADVMLPLPPERDGRLAWRMVEVKSSTSVKDYYRDDVAIQAYVAREAGVPLRAIALAHIDSSWVYPGDGDYAGLLVEQDLSEQAFGRGAEVAGWISAAQVVARQRSEPPMATGDQCTQPNPCSFSAYCQGQQPAPEYPVQWLPRVQSKALKTLIRERGVRDMREVPDDLLNAPQLRVKHHTLAGSTYFDAAGAAAELKAHQLPAYFLDFETIQFAVPRWAGTRPYEQLPFQFSLHRLARNGELSHDAFLDLSGASPLRSFAEQLIACCGEQGPVFVYNAGFETGRIRELAARFPQLSPALLAINARVVDLLPLAQRHFYHPSQCGSWSIKQVLPALAPELRYDALDGVQDGGAAMRSYLEAIAPATTAARRQQIEQQLLAYCELDTLAMLRLWQVFCGQRAPGA